MGLPEWMNNNRRTDRAPTNPMDKATVVSIYPREIDEVKHTISPGRFIIPPGTFEKPATLVVGPSSWWREIDADQPLLEIPTSSIVVAEAIIKDYCNSIFGVNAGESSLGLFYVMGEHDVASIKGKFPHELMKAKQQQRKWYELLIKAADSLWARSNGNPLAISDDMRMAATEMGIHEGKDWMKHQQMVDQVRCLGCGSLKNPLFPICATCKTVSDPAKFKELGLQFAS